MEGVLREPLVAPSWTASVLDPAGVIVARVPARSEFIGQPATPEIVRALHERPEGSLRAFTKEGTPVLATFSKAPQTGYSVVLGVPEDELLAPVRRTAWLAGWGMAIVLAVSLGLAVVLARRITHTIDELADAARDVKRGHVPGAARLGFQEAEQVRLAMNISAAELQQTHSELERLQAELAQTMLAQLPRLIGTGFSAVLVVDRDMRVLAANAAARALFARTSDALGGLGVRTVFEPAGPPDDAGNTQGVVRGADGVQRAAQLRSEPFELAGAKFRLVVLQPRDASSAGAATSASPAAPRR